MPIEIKPAKATKAAYAEKPFSVYDLKMSGDEVTIEEALNFSMSCPRIIKVKNFIQEAGKETQYHDAVGITVSNGMFKKDLALSEDEWTKLCAYLPSTLITLQGVRFKVTSGANKRDSKFIYLGIARQDIDGNQYNNASNFAQDKPGQTNEAPTTTASQIQALHAAIETNVNTGIKNTPEKVLEIANKIRPGDGEHLIQAAKDAGWLVEVGGVIRGT